MGKKILVILAILMGISGTVLLCTQTKSDIPGQRDLDMGSCRGYAMLSVRKPKLEIGERFSVDIRFVNKGGGHYFYNPFFIKLIPLPGRLSIPSFFGRIRYNSCGGRRIVSPRRSERTCANQLGQLPPPFRFG